ncbi:uncharacterized protein LOC131860310 [Cryptomeria japonica]|uniref:uncharacterized protein LOC131860310 n=1 Tax=Cryptomeria japonica TaxID=3369 RepID=UPI0027DA49C5|nr:uncharacterized protein LOC131860310 [Cryptomeria japonica]
MAVVSNSLVFTGSKPSQKFSEAMHAQKLESSFVGESSKLKKVNGCLPRSQDRPVLVISPESVQEDIAYWSQHVLICKFLGIQIPLSALESWIRRTWHVEGDFDLLVAANGYFMVDFSSISDRNRVFEGGPYFYNHVGLFIKPWHSGFNATEDLPTRVPVWVRLPWLPLEFWREDILLRIAALLGKPAAIAQNNLEKKVFSYARICVEIDLNNPLPDSLEIFIGSASWIQPLDYESLPFRCRFCHEYGHLQCQCPRAPKAAGVSSSPSSGPSVEKGDKGKESGVEGGPDKDGFIPVKQRNKGRGHKRAFKDSQNDQGFNRFEVLDNQAVEEGIPVELSAGASGMDVGMDTGLEKVIVVQNSSSALVQGSSEPPGASVDVKDDIVLADLAKAVFSSGKGRGSSPSLGVLQRPLKKGHFEFSSKVGRKKDADKLKSTGDLLVESGAIKTLEAHFSQPSS